MVVNSKIPITKLENQDNWDCYLFLARSWSSFYELCRLRPDEPKNSSAFVGTEEQRCSTVFSRNVTGSATQVRIMGESEVELDLRRMYQRSVIHL
jgi:hypothetical protein